MDFESKQLHFIFSTEHYLHCCRKRQSVTAASTKEQKQQERSSNLLSSWVATSVTSNTPVQGTSLAADETAQVPQDDQDPPDMEDVDLSTE